MSHDCLALRRLHGAEHSLLNPANAEDDLARQDDAARRPRQGPPTGGNACKHHIGRGLRPLESQLDESEDVIVEAVLVWPRAGGQNGDSESVDPGLSGPRLRLF